MVDKIVVFVSRIIFGKQYLEGYITEPDRKEECRLISLFPNEVAKEKAISVLEKSVPERKQVIAVYSLKIRESFGIYLCRLKITIVNDNSFRAGHFINVQKFIFYKQLSTKQNTVRYAYERDGDEQIISDKVDREKVPGLKVDRQGMTILSLFMSIFKWYG